jgi:hypothetical protein
MPSHQAAFDHAVRLSTGIKDAELRPFQRLVATLVDVEPQMTTAGVVDDICPNDMCRWDTTFGLPRNGRSSGALAAGGNAAASHVSGWLSSGSTAG